MAKNIFLYIGDEKISIKKKIENKTRESKATEFNIVHYDLEETNIADAMRDAITPPFMSDSKVIILDNPKFLTNEKIAVEHKIQTFIDYLKQPMDTTYLLIDACGIKLDEKKEVVKSLIKIAEVNESKELSEIELYGWLKRYCDIADVTIKDEQVKEFFKLVGKNMLNAKNEADKLINYVGPNGIITTSVVQNVVIRELENNVFALSNAIIENDKNKVITIYRDLIKNGNESKDLLPLIMKAMKDNLIVDLMLQEDYNQSDIALAMNVSSGRAYHLVRNAKNLKLEVIRKYVYQLGELDYKIKSGSIDAKTGLEFFLFGL